MPIVSSGLCVGTVTGGGFGNVRKWIKEVAAKAEVAESQLLVEPRGDYCINYSGIPEGKALVRKAMNSLRSSCPGKLVVNP